MSWLKILFRHLHVQLLQVEGEPEPLARGLALGIFAGLTPFWGLHAVLALATYYFFRSGPYLLNLRLVLARLSR